MKIDKKIDLENLKHKKIIEKLESQLPDKETPKQKKVGLLKYMTLSKEERKKLKDEKLKIKIKSRIEREKKIHNRIINELDNKKRYFEILFNKKPVDTKQEKEKADVPIFHYDHTAKYSPFRHPIKSIKKFWWRNFEKEFIILVNMELNNGKHISFIRPIGEERFKLFGATYIIDTKLAYYSLSAGMNCLDYHQSFTLPIKRSFPVSEIREAVKNTTYKEIIYATNPNNLDKFLHSNIIEQMFSDRLQGIVFIVMILVIVSIVLGIASIGILFFKFGALQKSFDSVQSVLSQVLSGLAK